MGPKRHTRQINDQSIKYKACTNKNSNANRTASIKTKYKIDSVIAGPERNADIKPGAEFTKVIHDKFKDDFTDIGCFKGMFSLQIKEGAKLYKVSPQCVAYVLQKLFKDKVDRLKKRANYFTPKCGSGIRVV